VDYRRYPLAVTALTLLGAFAGARADIFAFTDESGTVHYSNVPDNTRYQLMVRTPVAEQGRRASPKRVAGWLAHAADFDRLIEDSASDADVRPALIRAVIVVESGFNPRAVSRKGAMGLMQLLPATARRYGAFNALDPAQNIHAGAMYLADLLVRFHGNLELSLAAYNAGEGAVDRAGGRVPAYPETRAYVPNVLAVYQALDGAAGSG